MATQREKFLNYLQTCVKTTRATDNNPLFLGGNAPKDYVRFLDSDRLFDYNPSKWEHIGSMYEINDYKTALDVFNKLVADKAFVVRDKEDNQGWRRGSISHYVCFLRAQEFFTANTNFVSAKTVEEEKLPKVKFDGSLPLQQIFYGAPGTGKSHGIKAMTDGGKVIRSTFHPDSDYSTFVGVYKPTTISVPVTTIIEKEQVEVKGENKLVYKFVPQAFLKAYTSAWKNQEQPCFLIIEEINRGNCAQIFGDLFQLLDRNDETGCSEYSISPDEDIQKFLQTDDTYGFAALTDEQRASIPEGIASGKEMLLPGNLYIWATMNTSDQSLFPIDSAFKRRWDWKYIPISDAKKDWQIEANGLRYDWWQFLQKINDKIESATYSEDKKLGYFFCKAKDGIIDAETFVGKVLFYIWNDVFKDSEEAGDLFKDEDGSPLSYHKFYTVDGDGNAKIAEDKVVLLLKKLGLVPVEVEDSEIEETEEEGSIPNKGLCVLFNGRTYNEKKSIETLAKVIEAIGVERVASMGLTYASYPLLSKEKLDYNVEGGYGHGLRRIGDYWMISKYSNEQKETFLRKIKESLNLDLEII